MLDFRRWLLRNIGVSVSVVLVFAILIILLANDISHRADTIVQQRQDLVRRSEAFNYLATLRFDSEKAKELSGKLRNSIPTRDQLINFSKNFEGLAKNNRLDLGLFFESEIPSTDLVPGINNFKITSRGSYSDFLSFLRSVEASQYFVNFTSLDLTQKGKEFEIAMRGKVFSQ